MHGATLNAGLLAVILRGSRSVLLRNPIFFVIFQGGSGLCLPSGSAHEVSEYDQELPQSQTAD